MLIDPAIATSVPVPEEMLYRTIDSILLSIHESSWNEELWRMENSTIPARLSQVTTERRVQYLAGRAVAHELLSRNSCQVRLTEDSRYRPIWPRPFVGSIAHAGQWVWCAIGKDDNCAGIGIDIEPVIDQKDLDIIRKQITTDEELESLLSLDLSACELLTVIHAIKESVFKVINPSTNIFLEPSQVMIKMKRDMLIATIKVGETNLELPVKFAQQEDMVLASCLASHQDVGFGKKSREPKIGSR